MHDEIDNDRRRFLGTAAMTLAAASLGVVGSAGASSPSGHTPTSKPTGLASSTSFKPIKQIDAGLLNVGYAEDGPADGPPVILLHGWPYDIHSYVEVAPILAAKGYRVIVPYLRGFGTTRFRSQATPRNGQPSAVALDTIDLMDALGIERAVLA